LIAALEQDGPEKESVGRLAAACAAERLSPNEVVRLHSTLCFDLTQSRSIDLASYAFSMSLLERVLRELHTGGGKTVHDLRNGVQMITGAVSLLERDIRQNEGARTPELLDRIKTSAWEMARRIEALSSRRK